MSPSGGRRISLTQMGGRAAWASMSAIGTGRLRVQPCSRWCACGVPPVAGPRGWHGGGCCPTGESQGRLFPTAVPLWVHGSDSHVLQRRAYGPVVRRHLAGVKACLHEKKRKTLLPTSEAGFRWMVWGVRESPLGRSALDYETSRQLRRKGLPVPRERSLRVLVGDVGSQRGE